MGQATDVVAHRDALVQLDFISAGLHSLCFITGINSLDISGGIT